MHIVRDTLSFKNSTRAYQISLATIIIFFLSVIFLLPIQTYLYTQSPDYADAMGMIVQHSFFIFFSLSCLLSLFRKVIVRNLFFNALDLHILQSRIQYSEVVNASLLIEDHYTDELDISISIFDPLQENISNIVDLYDINVVPTINGTKVIFSFLIHPKTSTSPVELPVQWNIEFNARFSFLKKIRTLYVVDVYP